MCVLVLASFFVIAATAPQVFAETENYAFMDGYAEFLAAYADTGSEEEVEDLRAQLNAMPSENQWLQQATTTLFSAVDSIEKDPKASDAAVLQSALYVTKGLSDQTSNGRSFTHQLTQEERSVLLVRLRALQDTEWIRANKTVMTVAGLLVDFLKKDDTLPLQPV